MSETEFWQYAKEAMLSACDAKTDDDKQALLDLARTTMTSRRCLILRGPGRKRRYKSGSLIN
jgi:hypothetical protein